MAGEEINLNFHISSGEDYYSQDENNSRVKLGLILDAVNHFDWDNLDIKDEETQRRLAKKIEENLRNTS